MLSRWLFLRAMGVIYFSVFYSLIFQIRGLLGPDGLLPTKMYLNEVAQHLGASRYWYAPTVLWLSSSNRALMALCCIGLIASLLLILNLWPRAMLVICWILFLSFVTAAQDFSGYQSDGMLLSAGLICIFFVPRGFRPGFGVLDRPSRATLFLLQLVWFSIYFDSGWRNILAAILRGGTSRRWTSIIKTGRCPRGWAGTCSKCRSGFIGPRQYSP